MSGRRLGGWGLCLLRSRSWLLLVMFSFVCSLLVGTVHSYNYSYRWTWDLDESITYNTQTIAGFSWELVVLAMVKRVAGLCSLYIDPVSVN